MAEAFWKFQKSIPCSRDTYKYYQSKQYDRGEICILNRIYIKHLEEEKTTQMEDAEEKIKRKEHECDDLKNQNKIAIAVSCLEGLFKFLFC